MLPFLSFYYLCKIKPHDVMELLKYFYHPDHLGSSSWITDGSGQAIQHLHYLPFGEDWVDQRNSSWNAPYTFSGKEKDVETGYGYFGARYYDSGLSIWLSVDPMAEKYPHQTNYVYCSNNPVIIVDPNGEDEYFNEFGVYLGSDNSTTSNKNKVIRQDLWDLCKNTTKTENGTVESIFEETGNFMSTLASESNLSDKAQLNIYNHYNDTDVPIVAMQKGNEKNQDNGKSYGMNTNNLSGSLKIEIRLEGNKNQKIIDNVYEIKSIFGHEKQHVSDYRSGIRRTYNENEKRAYTTQINDPTFLKTRPDFQTKTREKARTFGVNM